MQENEYPIRKEMLKIRSFSPEKQKKSGKSLQLTVKQLIFAMCFS
jgi:hypothetical protein